eukprot:CAMPEP_0195515882 /NCGR_PEP_ID=MMETSP0794_2-20130614/6793_1 /TAXON_ID=515487 /ORGANISM="Stephanopyxis turris, Strain CCMP 815" /LENGTH=152 /DNA_ID=CAMNT_0040644375 /DNA_START=74 /DNA_END=532 /DNA_ORIENTATION=-
MTSDTPSSSTQPPPPTTIQSRRSIYVGGLADSITEVTLRSAMISFGPIRSIEMPRDYAKGTHKGFGFVEYEDCEDAAEAIYNMDGSELMGRVLSVSLAKPHQHKLGSHKPVWSTDEWFKEQSGGQDEEKPKEKQNAAADAAALKENAPVPSS